jgi:hypothetical protein
MNNLVERLRNAVRVSELGGESRTEFGQDCIDAASLIESQAKEIERLSAEVRIMRNALESIRYYHLKYPQLKLPDMQADRVSRALDAAQQESKDG